MKKYPYIAVAGMLALAVALAGCAGSQPDAADAPDTHEQMEGQTDPTATDMVACAYDGMHMRVQGMAAQMEHNGETLYFCNERQKGAFEKNPDRYLQTVEMNGDLTAILNVLTDQEYEGAMADMNMEPEDLDANRYVAVSLRDADGNWVQDANVTVTFDGPGGERSVELPFTRKMGHYSAGVDIPQPGSYTVRMEAHEGEDSQSGEIQYTVEA